MSSRIYPLYRRGNPQLRIFLPNFWMRLVRPRDEYQTPNILVFHVSPGMTRLDVKNYLEKIYGIPVADVKTRQSTQKILVSRSDVLYKKHDHEFKVARVTMLSDHSFTFPDVTKPLEDADKEDPDKALKDAQKTAALDVSRKGVPSFFGL